MLSCRFVSRFSVGALASVGFRVLLRVLGAFDSHSSYASRLPGIPGA